MLRTKFSARFISVVALVALCLLSIVVVAQLGSLPAATGDLPRNTKRKPIPGSSLPVTVTAATWTSLL